MCLLQEKKQDLIRVLVKRNTLAKSNLETQQLEVLDLSQLFKPMEAQLSFESWATIS